jgi:hypothetical protein
MPGASQQRLIYGVPINVPIRRVLRNWEQVGDPRLAQALGSFTLFDRAKLLGFCGVTLGSWQDGDLDCCRVAVAGLRPRLMLVTELQKSRTILLEPDKEQRQEAFSQVHRLPVELCEVCPPIDTYLMTIPL